MEHTLVSVFDNRGDAERAMDELLAAGFSRQEVRISRADATGQTDSVTGRPTTEIASEPRDEGIGASIKHFFGDIFGTDSSPHVQKYSDAVSRGHHVLTVSASDEPEIERAADIVERFNPVDIDEKAVEWAGGAVMGRPESMRMSGAGGMQQSASMSAQSESLLQPHGEPNLFQQQSLNEGAPMGTTYQEPMGDAGNLSSSTTTGASMQGSTSTLQGSQQRDTTTTGASVQGSSSTLQGSQQRDTASTGTTAIPVVEERLKVGKREVQRGGVRVYSRVVETAVTESIGLREEHVNVERHKVDQPISSTDTYAFKDQQIELRETAEEPVVEKSARVVEEVVVGKQVTEHQEEISDTLRHTEVQVEQLGAGIDDDAYYRRHWQSRFASGGGRYEDFAPAYSYGSEMGRNERYRGRSWNDVESDLRSGWDARDTSGGPSTWEKVKEAVRHGWEKIAGDADEDRAYRSHWSSNYAAGGGSYDDYAPAYSYGSQMARSDKYRGRQWNDVESDLRSDWDTRNGSGGASTWEKFKAAVRHGWERISS